jgi:sugar phosphate isomerase/epimerase
MVREMTDLGFTSIELSHGIRISLVPGILKAVEEELVKVSSVHNFCPLPTGVNNAAPNLYEPTSFDSQEVALWHRYTRRSIDFAATIGAGCVVLHSGSVRFRFRNPAHRVHRYLAGKPAGDRLYDPVYTKLIERSLGRIRAKSVRFMANLRAAFGEIIPYARQHGILLGVENREGLVELPIDDEMACFLDELPGSELVGYWHDSGHAAIKEQYGLLDHRAHLLENGRRLVGFHLHDVNESGRDHQPIGCGIIDFGMIAGFFRPDHVVVLELSPRLSVEEVLNSRDFLMREIEKAS